MALKMVVVMMVMMMIENTTAVVGTRMSILIMIAHE